MANAPITDILMPDEKARGRLIVATGTLAATGGAAVTLTLSNSYPPIDRSLTCPILAAIAAINTIGAMGANDVEGFNIANSMILAPDSLGEHLVSGDRTIDFYQTNAVAQSVIVAYIAKGSGTKV